MRETVLQYGIWRYVDDLDDIVMTAYVAWPERLYLVGIDGRASSRNAGVGGFLRCLPV